jgi:hypothetical protein
VNNHGKIFDNTIQCAECKVFITREAYAYGHDCEV